MYIIHPANDLLQHEWKSCGTVQCNIAVERLDIRSTDLKYHVVVHNLIDDSHCNSGTHSSS